MAAQKGKKMLLQIGNNADPTVYTTICGMRAKTLGINNTTIDATHPDCTDPDAPLFQITLDGVKSFEASGSGIFTGSQAEKDFIALSLTDDARGPFRIVVPGLGTFDGTFCIANCNLAGPYDDAVSYDISLASSGALTFTAEA